MMRKEAKEWCQYEDRKYIDHLKEQIKYFNQRLVVRSMEGDGILSSVVKMLSLLEDEISVRKEEYRRDYEDNTLQSGNEGFGKGLTFADGCAKAADHFIANVKQQDPRVTSGEDDSDRGKDIDGKDSVHNADNDGPR